MSCLSAPSARRLIHTRQITCQGYRREDGLWDIEGHLLDTKTDDLPRRDRDGAILAGTPIHQMRVRVTVDDSLLIHAVEAVIEDAPFEPCPTIAQAFSSLAGLSLQSGFLRAVRDRFGGVKGCTHVVELMGPVATTAFQTIYPVLSRERPETGRPNVIDSCHALAADGSVVARAWPQFSVKSP